MSRDIDSPASTIVDRPIGWLLAIALPFAIYYYRTRTGADAGEDTLGMFIAVVSSTLVMWVFSLLPALIPALFAILLCMLLGLAPPDIVLSGFSSNGFMLTFSVLGLGVVVTTSGLTKRYSLLLIRSLPPNTFWYQAALMGTGLLFTPIVPSIAGRAAIAGPITGAMAECIDEQTRRKASGMLHLGGLDSTSLLAAAFLTAAPANLIIFGMLPAQEQLAFQFIHWLYAASVTTAVVVLLYFLISAAYFRAYHRATIDIRTVTEELERIGPMSSKEWSALFGIAVLALGIMTTSVHKIPVAYIAFTVFFALMYLNVLTRDEFLKQIDWSFLFLLASIIGIVRTMNHLELDKVLSAKLSMLGQFMIQDFELFVLVLSGAILLVRLSLPINTTVLVFSAALIPIAHASGVNPWLVGFIILIMAETSVFSFQSPHIQLFRNSLHAEVPCRERDFIVFHLLLVGAKLAAIYVSLPFWKWMGVL